MERAGTCDAGRELGNVGSMTMPQHPFSTTSPSTMRAGAITVVVCAGLLLMMAVARTVLEAAMSTTNLDWGSIVLAWAPALCISVSAVVTVRTYRRARAGIGYPVIPQPRADGSMPPGFYPFGDVKHQFRWWNGSEWEDRWELVPGPGATKAPGRGAPLPQILIGGALAVAGFAGIVWLFGSAIASTFELAGTLLILALVTVFAVGTVAFVNGVIGFRRRADRRRVGSR